ncbi:MAG TPA: ABC transporter permease [Vicinamibacterales bacterium]|nr:ABC transporter permease [Vicinamibacterales bacterium]
MRLPVLLFVALLAAALAAPIGAPYAPERIDLASRREPPSAAHLFGTDELGRDVFSRVLFGARVSLAVGLFSAAVAGASGVAVGGIAGYAGGAIDASLMRATDAMLAVPRLPLLMIAAVVLQPSIPWLIVLIGLAGWMETARVVRAELRSLRGTGFVESARASGASHARILVRHLLPNAAPVIAVSITLAVARGILLESALSFFGVGVRPPAASWGNMLYQAQAALATEPWLAIAPGACILMTTMSVALIGDRLAAARGRNA